MIVCLEHMNLFLYLHLENEQAIIDWKNYNNGEVAQMVRASDS